MLVKEQKGSVKYSLEMRMSCDTNAYGCTYTYLPSYLFVCPPAYPTDDVPARLE